MHLPYPDMINYTEKYYCYIDFNHIAQTGCRLYLNTVFTQYALLCLMATLYFSVLTGDYTESQLKKSVIKQIKAHYPS